MEHRQTRRYELDAFVKYSWESPDGDVGRGEGHTRDISVAGVFLVTAGRPPVGSLVRMDVSLPPLRGSGPGARLSTKGRVIRIDSQGFAAIADMGFHMQLQENSVGKRTITIVPDRERDDILLWPGTHAFVS